MEQFRCIEFERGWIISNNLARTDELIATWRRKAATFEKIFRRPVARGIVFLYTGGKESDGLPPGARWELDINDGSDDSVALAKGRTPWEASTVAGIRRRWPKKTEREIQDSVAQLWAERLHGQLHEDSFFSHEATHEWVNLAYPWDPDGRPAARWLNEAVAMAVEAPWEHQERLAQLADSFRTDSSFILPLEVLFASDHPLGIMDFSRALAWYAQSVAVLDFLVDRTGDSAIAGVLMANEAHGHSIVEWLRGNGPQYDLPSTLDDLEHDWRRWFTQLLAMY